jgi:hypothetical protein
MYQLCSICERHYIVYKLFDEGLSLPPLLTWALDFKVVQRVQNKLGFRKCNSLVINAFTAIGAVQQWFYTFLAE